jgi:hypothetical protein
MKRPRSVLVQLACLLFVYLSTTASDCVGLKSAAEKLADTIDTTTARMVNESANWRQAVADLENQLNKDTSALAKQVLNDINATLQRTVATTGTEIRCDVDFVSNRVRSQLENISRGLRGIAKLDLPPAICQVVPTHIDLRLPPEHVGVFEIYGYDFPANSADLRVKIRDVNHSETDVTNKALQVPHHYLATLNLSATGIGPDLHSSSRAVVLYWKNAVLSSVAVVDRSPDIDVEAFTQVSTRVPHPRVAATVPSDFVLIGGGCRAEYLGSGQLLTASFPDGSSWVCQSKDHAASDPAHLTAFALGIPKSEGIAVRVDKVQGPIANHPEAVASVPTGFRLVGGGCATSWADPQPGNLLVNSFPTSGQWHCEGKDHRAASPASITAYAISIPASASVKVVTADSASDRVPHPVATVGLPKDEQLARVVGGGCAVTYAGEGNLLTAMYPDGRQWQCRSKDHGVNDPATARAYVIGIVRVPR